MLTEQHGVCAICDKPETSLNLKKTKVRNLAVDHCHKTGKVRALLCMNCNTGLVAFRDDTDMLTRAIAYLKGFRE